ncbi:MAG: LVIVD repeat-containing protein [Saprospiraceae bacterium]
MHKAVHFFIQVLMVGTLALSLTGCLQDDCEATRTFIQFEPIYRTEAQIRQEIKTEAPRALENPGKIYVYGDYLLINEVNAGIHIIDNQDPRNPKNLTFINIPGNVDMAVRNNMLYADRFIDLITINISNPAQPVVAKIVENCFPSLGFDATRGHLIGYREVEVTQNAPCDWQDGWWWREGRVFVAQDAVANFTNQNRGKVTGASVPGGNGIGGSMARFSLMDHYLYTVDNNSLRVFDVKNEAEPNPLTTVNIGWGIETIFPYNNNLFIGSRNGMFIYDASNPLQPTQLSFFQHAQACDPVFVDGDIAYVTLRDGTECQNFNNQLDIINIKDLKNPKLLKTHPMHRPHGLSVVEGMVYLCDDDQGLKVFDAKDYNKLDLQSHLKHFRAYDVITLPWLNQAIVVGKDGLYQFDITNPAKLQELSRIPISQ